MAYICKDIDIEVVPNDPFKNDELHRGPVALTLTTIANAYTDSGAVLAIDGEWGAGKTTFVKMWKQHLEDNGYNTLYFNAWETDFVEDPLIALMGELKEVFGKKSSFETLTKNFGRIGFTVGREVFKAGVKKVTGIDSDIIETAIDETTNICYEQIKSYNEHKAELEDFKKKLSEFVASEAQDNNHPIIFFIDVLDRCNPHYAVKLLERVKHLFEVPNIIFVLAVNIHQLQHAIQGYYGSSDIDGEEYLKRFIDLNYSLPAPNLEDYVKVLYNKHSFDDYFENDQRMHLRHLDGEKDLLLSMAKDLISYSNVNLRTANKIFAYTRLVLQGYSTTAKVSPDLLFLLCFVKLTRPILYNRIGNGEYKIQELVYALEDELPAAIFIPKPYSFTERHLSWAVAALIVRYNYSSNGKERESDFKGIKCEGQSYFEFPIKTKKLNKTELFKALTYFYNNDPYNVNGLEYMLEKINLMCHLKL